MYTYIRQWPHFDPPAISYFIHVSITTPIVFDLKNYVLYLELSRSPSGFFYVTVSEAKRLQTYNGYM